MGRLFRQKYKGQAGFTLIELMLVIAIIGILALYSVPKYYAMKDHYRLESAAQKVASQLDYGKQMAMDKRENIYVIFQQDKVGVYRVNGSSLEIVGPPMYYEGGVTFTPDNHLWLPLCYSNISSGTLLGRGLQYDFRGFAQQSGNIVLQTLSTQTIQITVEEKTGKIVIQ